MLRAFLIVWTLVAGLAAGGLLYVVGWRPQVTVVADQILPTKNSGRADLMASAGAPIPPDTTSSSAAASPPGSVSPAPSSVVPADMAPTTTGSIGLATGRSSTRTVRRVDNMPTVPSVSPDTTEQAADEKPTPSAVRSDVTSPAQTVEATVLPPARPAALSQGASLAPKTVPLGAPDEEAGTPPALTRSAARAESKRKTDDRSPLAGSGSTTAASGSPNRPTPEAAARPKDVAVRSEPDNVDPSEEMRQGASNRALKQRARETKRQATRAAELTSQERTRAAAVADERLVAARQRAGNLRQARTEARIERRARVARGNGSLERLLDDFSRSGADFLHERTTRVGTGYLVERTTRHGTQYYYQRSAR